MAEGASDPGRSTAEAAVSAFLHGRGEGDPGVKASFRGGHRTAPPETLLDRLLPLLPDLGITRSANITHLDRLGIPVSAAVRPGSRSRVLSHAAGLTPAAAKAAAVMRAAERHHAEDLARPLRFGSEAALQAEGALVDLSRLPQLADAEPAPSRRSLWVEGRDLLGDTALWLPYEAVSRDLTLPPPPGSGRFPMGSAGLGSGSHVLEAVCAALCDAIVCDATTLWSLGPEGRRLRTRLELESIDDEDCRAVLARLAAAGLEVGLWETTSDIAVPSFRCLVVDRREPPGPAGLGAGCHPDRTIALMGALLQAVEGRLAAIAGDASNAAPPPPDDARDEIKTAEDGQRRRFAEVPHSRHETFAQDVGQILDRLQARGIEQAALVVLTPADAPYHVVQLVVPGLEARHDAPSYRPGPRARGLGLEAPSAAASARGRRVSFREAPPDAEAAP